LYENSNDETLSKSYTDYATWLMRRQMTESGALHFALDNAIVMVGKNIAAGMGYEFADGRVQPGCGDDLLRVFALRTQAVLQENGVVAGGLSGHAGNALSLKSLPFFDAMLISESATADPVDAFPRDKMIALSCPETFGVAMAHLPGMNADWAALH